MGSKADWKLARAEDVDPVGPGNRRRVMTQTTQTCATDEDETFNIHSGR